MAVFKFSLILALLLSVRNGGGTTSLFGDDGFFKTFQEGLRELEEASRRVTAEARGDASREELEEADDRDTLPDPDLPGEPEEESDLSTVFGRLPALFKIFQTTFAEAWYKGPNVCVEQESKKENSSREEGDGGDGIFVTGTAQFSSCKQSPARYSCKTVTHSGGETKTSTVTYRCCHGYRRAEGKPGCSKVETKPLLRTATEDLGCSRFAAAVESSALSALVERSNATVFAPTDDAWNSYAASRAENGNDGRESNDVEEAAGEKSTSAEDVLRNHVVEGLVETSDFRNDAVLETAGGSGLRINVFPGPRGPRLTVNCASFNRTDVVTDTGVVHSVGTVLAPVRRTVLQILGQPEYSKFRKLLEENDLLKGLEGDGPFTVLAVDDERMSRADVRHNCMKNVLEHHILPNTVCSVAAETGRLTALDSAGNWLALSRDDRGRTLLDDSVEVVVPDILATNGLVHRVQRLVVPQSAISVKELLTKRNHTKFLGLLERFGLLEEAENTQGLALFVPPESSLGDDAQDLEESVRYHVATDKRSKDGRLHNGLKLKTKLEGKVIRIESYRDVWTPFTRIRSKTLAQCTEVSGYDGEVCSGVVREVAGLLSPPESSLYGLIQSRPEFAAFKRVLEGTKLEAEIEGGLESGAVTVLVPTGEALRKMGVGNYDTLLKDKPLADQILRAHVLTHPVCCSSVEMTPFTSSVRTLSGTRIDATKTFQPRHDDALVAFGGVPVKECDLLATDGVAHLVDGVMLPAGQRKNTDIIFKKPNSEIILTGF